MRLVSSTVLSLCVLAMAPASALAQPTMTRACVRGDAVVVSGTSFPEPADMLPLFVDDFESGSPGAPIADGGGAWVEGAVSPLYSDELAFGGNQAGIADYDRQESDWVQAYVEFDQRDEAYTSAWIYVDYGPDPEAPSDSNSLKLLSLYSSEFYTGRPSLDWTSMGSTSRNALYSMYGAGGGTYVYEYGTGFQTGRWIRGELYFRLSSPAGAANGQAQAWLDGVDQEILVDQALTRDEGVERGLTIAGFWRGWARSPAGAKVYVDDAYVGATRARVEVGVGARFEDAARRQLQRIEEASADEITVSLRLHAFAADADLHLYVIDADGRASDGHPLTDLPPCDPVEPDAGGPSLDAGPARDGGADMPDAGAGVEEDDAPTTSGGCRAAGQATGTGRGLLLVLPAVVAGLRRRRAGRGRRE